MSRDNQNEEDKKKNPPLSEKGYVHDKKHALPLNSRRVIRFLALAQGFLTWGF